MGSTYGMSRWDEETTRILRVIMVNWTTHVSNPVFVSSQKEVTLRSPALTKLGSRDRRNGWPSWTVHYNWRAARFWMFESLFEHYGRRVSWYFKMYLDCRVWDITSIYTLCVGTSVQTLIVQPFRNLINSHKQFEKILFLSLNIILGRELRFI